MTSSPTIPRALPADAIDNFDALKQQAIAWLADSCGTNWSDFNAHDPGVQMIEELCYGLTELGYRASSPIEAIIGNQTGHINWQKSALFAPPEVFPMNPLTANDYRKLILDQCPAVINAWLTPRQSAGRPDGGYDVWVAVAPALPSEVKETIRGSVQELLEGHRNLGEYFAPVRLAQVVRFWPKDNFGLVAEQALAELCLAVQAAVLAWPPSYTLADRKAAGERLSQTLTGPLPEHGIILDADLGDPPTWDQVQQQAMAAILRFAAPGIRVKLALEIKPTDPRLMQPTVFHFAPFQKSPNFALPPAVEALIRARPLPSAPLAITLIRAPGWSMPKLSPAPPGQLTKYRSIQDGFPPNYALGQNEAPLEAPALRRAQIKQLKGYLLFFEQILANGLAQLGKAGELLSGRPPSHTYFTQPIYDVPGIAPLLKGFNDGELTLSSLESKQRMDAYRQNPANAYSHGLRELVDGPADFIRRSTSFLDHLLARFGESYPQRGNTTYETIANKSALLRDYPELGRARATGGHPAGPGNRHVSGLEAKLARLLARNNQSWPDIAGSRGARYYYLVEHSLLRPESGAPPEWPFRLTHVFVNWTAQPLTPDFQEYVQEIVIENCGAHLLHYFHWFERKDLRQGLFVRRYRAWAKAGFPCIQPDGQSPKAAAELYQWLRSELGSAAVS